MTEHPAIRGLRILRQRIARGIRWRPSLMSRKAIAARMPEARKRYGRWKQRRAR